MRAMMKHKTWLKARTLHGAALSSFLASLPTDQWEHVLDRSERAAARNDRWAKTTELAILEAWTNRED